MKEIEESILIQKEENANEGENFKYIIEGILDVKNNLLFNSKEEIKIEELEVFINNKKVKIKKEGKKYNFDSNIFKKKYKFKISFKNLIKNIYFEDCINLNIIDFTNFDIPNITDMSWMFTKCHELKKIKGINKFNTSKVTNMNEMFQECNKLINLDLNFDTSNITDMGRMFNKCHELKEIKGINKFNTNKVTNMRAMFQECNNLINLYLNFDTSNVNDMGWMFNKCHELKEIKGINKFNTNKVTNMKAMFQNCYKLINLDLNFDTSNVIDMGWMFTKCHELKEIKGINKFNTNKVTKW